MLSRYIEDALDLCDALGSYGPGAEVKALAVLPASWLDGISKVGFTGKPEGC